MGAEVTYDDKKGKLMIYFTMRFKNEANKLYYVYVNDDFDRIGDTPANPLRVSQRENIGYRR